MLQSALEYVLEIKSHNGIEAVVIAHWTEEECRLALAKIIRLASRTPDSTTSLYWIQISDENQIFRLFTTWDWTAEDLQIRLRQICRLAAIKPTLPAVRGNIDEPDSSPGRGGTPVIR